MPRHFQSTDRPLKPQVVAPLPLQIESLAEIAPGAVKYRFAPGDTHTAPPKVLPPAPITIDHWQANVAPSAVELAYSRGAVVAPATSLPPAAVTIAHWLANLAANAVKLNYASPDFAAPPKVLPPAPVTIDHWFANLAESAIRLLYAKGNLFTAPDKFGISAAEVITLDKWNPAAAAKIYRAIFAQADPYLAPSKVLPPAPVTIDHWLANLAPNAVRLLYAGGDLFTAPDKFGISALEAVTLDKWNPAAAASIYRAIFSQADPFLAPSKVLPPAPVTIDHWFANLAPSAIRLLYAGGDLFTAPDKFLAAAPMLPAIAALLSEFGLPARLFRYAPADVFTAPVKMPLLGNISFVQDTDTYFGNGTGVATQALAYGSSNTAGNFLFLVVGWESAGGINITSITDTAGNTWTALPAITGGPHRTQAFYAIGCNAGANTVTAHFDSTGGTYIQMTLEEYFGVNAAGPHAEASIAGVAFTSPGVTTTAPNSLVIGYMDDSENNPNAAGSGFTLRSAGSVTRRSAVEDELNMPAGSYSSTFSSPTFGTGEAGIATFYFNSETVTLDKWNPAAVAALYRALFTQAPTVAAPDKITTIPPALPNLAMWTPPPAASAIKLTYSQGPATAAPDKSISSIAASVSLASWFAEVARAARPPFFAQPEASSAPVRTLPFLESITLDKWNPAAPAALYHALFARAETLAPVRSLPLFVPPASWLRDPPAPGAQPPGFWKVDPYLAPAKVIPPEKIFLDKWAQAAGGPAAALYRAMHWMPDGYVGPVFSPLPLGPFVIFAKLLFAFAQMLGATPNATSATGFSNYPQMMASASFGSFAQMIASGGFKVILLDQQMAAVAGFQSYGQIVASGGFQVICLD